MSQGRGRPAVGPRVAVRLPVDVLAEVDAWAEQHDSTRAEVLRQIVTDWARQ